MVRERTKEFKPYSLYVYCLILSQLIGALAHHSAYLGVIIIIRSHDFATSFGFEMFLSFWFDLLIVILLMRILISSVFHMIYYHSTIL